MFDSKTKLYTLLKLVDFVKFECRDYESRYFAGSPIVGEILQELRIEYHKSMGEFSFEVSKDSKTEKSLVNSIEWHLSETDEWNDMDEVDKLEHIKNLASPYILNQEVLVSLVDYANLKHGGNPDRADL